MLILECLFIAQISPQLLKIGSPKTKVNSPFPNFYYTGTRAVDVRYIIPSACQPTSTFLILKNVKIIVFFRSGRCSQQYVLLCGMQPYVQNA